MERNGSKPQKFDPVITEGPIHKAVWKLAWPSMLQNVVAGLQGIIDHTLIGHYVGFTGNAAVGVSWQLFLVVIVFVGSVYTGMGILVARLAGAGKADQVNRVVYQAFLTSLLVVGGVLTPAGIFLAPRFLVWINATPEVQAEALPYLRTLLLFSFGLLFFYMIAAALRAAGDARTPLRLGILTTLLNLILSVVLIRGLGPIPAFGTLGAAMGTVIAPGVVSLIVLYLMFSDRLIIRRVKGSMLLPDWRIIRKLFRFGLPSGFQGIAMNLGGVLLLGFIGSLAYSAEAQAVYAVCYTQLFSLITWSSVGLMGATSTIVGQNLGALKPERAIQGARTGALVGLGVAGLIGVLFLFLPGFLLGLFGFEDPIVLHLGSQFLAYLSLSGLLVSVAINYTGALHGGGDTRSPMLITLVSQLLLPPGILFFLQLNYGLLPEYVWRVILLGHFLRCALSVIRFYQGRWLHIRVEM